MRKICELFRVHPVKDSAVKSTAPARRGMELKDIGNRACESVLSVVTEGQRVYTELSSIDSAWNVRGFAKCVVQHIVELENDAR